MPCFLLENTRVGLEDVRSYVRGVSLALKGGQVYLQRVQFGTEIIRNDVLYEVS